ncbi:MAG: hypothetical protein JJE46_14550 [Acidimicrobiia bacterium]|nr:hypothetical protein [Acidimicrobiia bacterium]
MASITSLDAEHGARSAPGTVADGRVLVDPASLPSLTGWTLKAEGLCRGDVCVPVRDPDLTVGASIDLARVAAALGRPAVVDADQAVVAMGEPSAARRGPIEAGIASDFTLPQLDGGSFTFSSLGRTKKLLLAWSSW